MASITQKADVALEYLAAAGLHDEAMTAEGTVREHWKYLLESLAHLGPAALQERHLKAQRILRDDGATYNIYSQPEANRVWSLDPVPLILNSEEWSEIESGLLERSELFNLLLKDIYGPRNLIKHGLTPPEILFGHRGFLRPCHDAGLPGDHQLITHAVDMVRDAEGRMCVLGDRTQAPSGSGYALENRVVMSRILPSLFRDSHVHRLALFFRSLRQKLNELHLGNGVPRIVVLTPGAFNETYFEHAYLANYLGYTLVQGGDLTVRKGYVWMKSLEGLRRVDVILRRVDDYYCDPVELKGDSHLGVPGLLDAVRAGRVIVANPLGSGVLEHPGFLKYLPELSRYFLGREPRLKTVTTYWCGDPADREKVFADFTRFVIKPTFRKTGAHSIVVATLTEAEQLALKADINNKPLGFVAQEFQQPSQSPTWLGDRLISRPAVLRSFSVASEASYTIMPGGLTRVGEATESSIVTNQMGSVSKDTWVIASEPEKQITLRTADAEVGTHFHSDHRTDLPSRVVENFFWMGRYAERAEAALRILRTTFMKLNGLEFLSPKATALLLRAITQVTGTYPGFSVDNPKLFERPEKELLSVILDQQRMGSVASSLTAMLMSAEEVKELLSADTQRVINDIGDELGNLKAAYKDQLTSAPEEALDPLVTALLALAGLCQESMVRGMGWRFLELGRRTERAMQTIGLLRATMVPVLDKNDEVVLLESVLMSVESLITYRRRHRGQMDPSSGLDLVMLDETNPRSLLYQLQRLGEHIALLPRPEKQRGLTAEARLVLEATTALQLSDVDKLCDTVSKQNVRNKLDEMLANLQRLLIDTSGKISEKHFDHTTGPQPLIRAHWEVE